VDFGDLKALMNRTVGDEWDHGFLVAGTDDATIEALHVMGPEHKTISLGVVPTVENLAAIAFALLSSAIKAAYAESPFKLHHVRLYETPNCWADVYADE
jgi:6-pyruvoyltetrahydropterin/6-carboxytetrahydropterin synthase